MTGPFHAATSEDKDARGEPVARAVIERALNMLRRTIRGNDCAVSKARNAPLTLAGFNGSVLSFEAYTIFRITHQLSRKTVNGRLQGNIVGNEYEFDALTAADIEGARGNALIHEMTIGKMLARPDMGFGAREHIIQLPQAAKQYIAHINCGTCHAQAQNLCTHCKGQGRVMCNRCHGTRDLMCPSCRGQRVVRYQQTSQPCTQCKGRGKISCTLCRASGQIPCTPCRASGKQACDACGGTGAHSLLATLTFQAEARFVVNNSTLPARAQRLIQQFGPALIARKMAQVERIQDPAYLHHLHEKISDHEFLIAYRVRMPFGAIAVKMDGKILKGVLCGWNGALFDMPPFLDGMIASQAARLAEAARTGNDAAMRKAMQARIVREAVQESANRSPAKTAQRLRRAYPCGLSGKMGAQLAQDARAALNNLTRNARYAGMGLGLSMGCAVYALYFCTTLRPLLAEMAQQDALMIVVDFTVLFLCAALTNLSSQYFVGRVLVQKLGARAGKAVRDRAAKRAGASYIFAALLALIPFVALIEIAHMAGRDWPVWYGYVRQMIAGLF